MNKDNCYYCNQSKLKYPILYCPQRIEERKDLLNKIYSLVLPEFQYWFTSSSRKQKGISAKKIGKNHNILGLRAWYKIIAFPMENISITRRHDVTHKATTMKDIQRAVETFKQLWNIDLYNELGITEKISDNIGIKTILTDNNNGFYFTGLTNANSRGGLKPLKGFFIEDIFDEPVEKDKILDYEENKKEESDYEVFISTIERDDTDLKGKYIIRKDDLFLDHKVLISTRMEINGKLLSKNKYIIRKLKKNFVRTEFSNPYINSHWTYIESLNYIPYHTNNINKLKNDLSIIYEDNYIFVQRSPLTINPTVNKIYYNELEKIKEKDKYLYDLLRYGLEYEGTADYKYIYRTDLSYTPRWDKNSLEYKIFDSYTIGIDIGSKNGDQTIYLIIGEKTHGFQIKEFILLKEIVYDKRIHQPLNSIGRFNLFINECITWLWKEYPNSKINNNKNIFDQTNINIAIPQDGDWIEGMIEDYMIKNQQYNWNIEHAITHGKEWGIIPRQDIIKTILSSSRLKLNKEDVPILYNDLWNCIKDTKTNKRIEKPNTVNSLNALEGAISIRSRFYPDNWIFKYLDNDKKIY